jgi:hypothetical protein
MQTPGPAPVISPTLLQKTVTKSVKGEYIIDGNSRVRGSGRAMTLKGITPSGIGQELSYAPHIS